MQPITKDDKKLTLRIVLNSGQSIVLFSQEDSVHELVRDPKFIQMEDDYNHVFISSDAIQAFEILNFRKQNTPVVPLNQPEVIQAESIDAQRPEPIHQ